MAKKFKIFLVIVFVFGAVVGRHYWLKNYHNELNRDKVNQSQARYKRVLETNHYVISSNASAAETKQVADAVESFYAAYKTEFQDVIGKRHNKTKLKLVLYQDRKEFKDNNLSSPWAEAFYRFPNSYAYYANGQANPYHWMVHEATHQLNREVSGFKKAKWTDEGLATYFGTSSIVDGKLISGRIDVNAYPIWWLSSTSLSGNLQQDISDGKIIPLSMLISGVGGPDFEKNVNLYYIEYWSTSHFLFHYDNGRYASGYKRLLSEGSSLEKFEQIIGPVNKVEKEWYQYLQDTILQVSEGKK